MKRLRLRLATFFALWSEQPRFSAFIAFACMVGAGLVIATSFIDRALCTSGLIRFC